MREERSIYGIVVPRPELFIQICQEVMKVTPEMDIAGAWYVDNYLLPNGFIMDIDFCPTMPYSVVNEEYDGVFTVSCGPEGAWSDGKSLRQEFTNTFGKFREVLLTMLKDNGYLT